jgi:DNA-binding transcriptional LysR family regulator
VNDGLTCSIWIDVFNLDDAYLFAEVVEHGGFTAAARATGQAKSTLSKRVGVLEEQLGLRLLHRNSRKLSLSEAGEDFYRHVSAMLVEAEAAEASIRNRLAAPRGKVRITASIITARHHLAPILPAIASNYPDVQIMLHATDRMVDIVQESFDIALRDHHDPLPSSELLQQRIGFEPNVLVAAPSYLDRAGVPADPESLQEHDGLLNGSITRPLSWRLIEDGSGANRSVTPRMRSFSDDPETLVGMTVAGLGIAALPRCVCEPHLARGTFVRILPDWIAGGATTTLLVPHRRGQLPAVRAVAEALVGTLRTRLQGQSAHKPPLPML